MDSFQSVLGDAAGGALCNVLSAYGSTAPLLTAISLVEPTPVGEALAVSAGLAGLAATVGCQWDTNGPGPAPVSDYVGCQKVSSGYLVGRAGSGSPENPEPTDPILFTFALEVHALKNLPYSGVGKYKTYFDITESNPPGSPPTRRNATVSFSSGHYPLYTYPDTGGVCEIPAPAGKPPQPPTYTHTDPASGCQLNVDFKGWGVNTSGNINGVWEIAPALPPARASGGIIGGCNFSPLIYVDGGGGGGGGGTYFPVPDPLPPDGDEPWWAPLARGAAQGLAAAAVQKALDEVFKTDFSGGSYELKGVCELDPDGNPMDVTRSTNYPPAPGLDAVLYRLDALAEMFQFDKELRQPTCKQQITPVTGEPVSINWVSDEYSPSGGNRLRKLLTYFDQAGSTLEETVAHWKDFTWNAGPVIVSVNGVSLGKPQVWAASAEEGKRVINHAAAIAGVDMTQADWLITSPRASRYGMTGLMRVHRSDKGILGITKRDGPSGLPTGIA